MPDDPSNLDRAFTDLTRDIASRVHAPTSSELIRRAGVQRGYRVAVSAAVTVAAVVLGVAGLAGRVPVAEDPAQGVANGSSLSSPTASGTTTRTNTQPPTTTPSTTTVPASAFLTAADVEAALDPWSAAAWRESADVAEDFDWGGCTYDDRWATRGVLRRDDGGAVVESQISVWPTDAHAAAAGADLAAPIAGCESNTSEALIVERGGEARVYGYQLPDSPEYPAGRREYAVVAWTGRAAAVVTLRTFEQDVLPERSATDLATAVLTRLRDLPAFVVSPVIPASTGTVPEAAFLTAEDLQFTGLDLRRVADLPPAVDWVGCVPADLGWPRRVLAAGDDYAVVSQIAVFDDLATTDAAFELLYRGLDTCVVDGHRVRPSDGISGPIGMGFGTGGFETMMTVFDLGAPAASDQHRIQQVVAVESGRTVAVVTVHTLTGPSPKIGIHDAKDFAGAVLQRIATISERTSR